MGERKKPSSPSRVRRTQMCDILIPAEESHHIPDRIPSDKIRQRRLDLLKKKR